ncbi:hypothetical protein MSTHC_1156 [Methanosarcina thermophila CHTI-55]|uniref:Uncharacterized protein n=1 Tax=Methanosarcina thermophila CHTI-55 TaxID=1434121 RepID=A0A0E3HA97_METTE|nr:hypothetical protein MSTHC_1156 [Methanosarcina thermophila CHTI-55]
MLVTHHDGSQYVPHIVLAPVQLILSREYIPGLFYNTLYTVLASFWVSPVKFRADILESSTCQNDVFEIS